MTRGAGMSTTADSLLPRSAGITHGDYRLAKVAKVFPALGAEVH